MGKNVIEESILRAMGNFKSEDVSSAVLPAGRHAVKLVSWAIIHSMANNDGSPKQDKTTEYADVTPQVYTVFGSTENKGAIAHRFQLEGYKHYDDLTVKQKESGKFTCSEDGYAMVEKNGQFFRVVDEENTAAAHRILSQAMKGMNIPVGSGIDALDDVVEDARVFDVVVKEKEYEGRVRFEVSAVKPVAATVDIAAEALGV